MSKWKTWSHGTNSPLPFAVNAMLCREFKLHVYCKRQTSDSSWEFLKIENEQIKTARNSSLWIKIAWDYWFMCRNKRQAMGETWSRGTNLRLPFDVNVMVNLSNLSIGGFHVTSSPPYWWTVDKRLLISSFCLSTSICSFHHCCLCLPRLHENHLFLKLYRGYLSPAQWSYSANSMLYLIQISRG